jgi:ATP-dependent RNA helicase DeaD
MLFKDAGLSDYILKALDKQGITEMTSVQARAIPILSAGKDLIGKSQTGTGKTFAFGIPSLEKVDTEEKFTQVLIICPTRELAIQVTGEMRKLTEYREGCKVVPIVGGSTMERQITALKSGAKIVVGTPGRLNDHIRRRTLKLANVKTVILDEADEMMDMGFLPEIETILSKANPYRQTVMFSATMPEPVKNIAKRYMKSPVFLEIDKTDANTAIDQRYVSVGMRDKDSALKELYLKLKPELAIIFCNTKRMVGILAKKLAADEIKALEIHGDMPQSERKSAIEAVKSGACKLLIATDVAARGLDIKGVDVVFNYDLPIQTEWYTHRIGRTGRAGKTGASYSLINTDGQMNTLKKIERETGNVLKEYYSSYSKDRTDKLKKAGKTPAKNGKGGRTGAKKGSSFTRYTSFDDNFKSSKKPYGKSGAGFKGAKNGKGGAYKGKKSSETSFGGSYKGKKSGETSFGGDKKGAKPTKVKKSNGNRNYMSKNNGKSFGGNKKSTFTKGKKR